MFRSIMISGDISTVGISECDIVIHQVNCQRVMGSGVAKALRSNVPFLFEGYVNFKAEIQTPADLLGEVYFHKHNGDCVANMFAQENYGYDGKCYTSYVALRECLRKVKLYCDENKLRTVGIPNKMSCVRGGADWDRVLDMIMRELSGLELRFYSIDGGVAWSII